MKRKYVKVFEELDRSEFQNLNKSPESIDSIDNKTPEEGSEGPPDEDDEAEEVAERPMTPGEKRAYARGLDILEEDQMAAMWIKAKDRIDWDQDRRRVEDKAQLTVLTDERRKACEDGDWTKATYGMLAKALELKDTTVTRTTTKFKRLQQGLGESESDVLYPKIIEAHERFNVMTPAEVKNLADGAVHFEGLEPTRKITKSSVLNPENVKRLKFSFMSLYAGTDTGNGYGKKLDVAIRRFITFCKTKEEYTEDQIDALMPAILKGTPFMEKGWPDYKRKLQNRPAPDNTMHGVMVGPGQDQTDME